MTTRPLGEMAGTAGDDPTDAAWAAWFASDHAVLLARARRAKLAQWTAFWVGVVLGIGIGVAVLR